MSENYKKVIAGVKILFRTVFIVHYKSVDELADTWCQWSELELRHEKFDNAMRELS